VSGKVTKLPIEHGDRVRVAVNTIGKFISTDIYMLPGKLFRDKFIRV